MLRVKGKIIRRQKAALKCTKRKLRASTQQIFIVLKLLIHGRPVGEVRGFLLYAGQEKWIIYYRLGWNKLSLCWVPRDGGWRNELTNQQKEQDVSINGQSQRKLNWNMSQLPADEERGEKLVGESRDFQSPSHHQLTSATPGKKC